MPFGKGLVRTLMCKCIFKVTVVCVHAYEIFKISQFQQQMCEVSASVWRLCAVMDVTRFTGTYLNFKICTRISAEDVYHFMWIPNFFIPTYFTPIDNPHDH